MTTTDAVKPPLSPWMASGIISTPIDRLIPYARNSRQHSADQVARLAGSIREFGWTQPVIADPAGNVLAGHGRLQAARQLGMDSVPVIVVDHLTDDQRRAYVIADNRLAELSTWDTEMLGVEIDALKAVAYDIELTGWDMASLAKLMPEMEPTIEGATGDDDTPPATQTPITRPGDVWIMGHHRLLCGDSTDAANYEILLLGQQVDMVFTDPPYNVAYTGSAQDRRRGNPDRPIANDAMDADFSEFIDSVVRRLLAYCDGGIYICMSMQEMHVLQRAFLEARGHWASTIIWKKGQAALGRGDYQRHYEPMLYGWRESVKRHWCGDRDQTDIWEFPRPNKNDLHPTMKPVALVERAIRNSSVPGDLVLDAFGGSGTTLIAADKSGRVARLIEIEPRYCDVIVRRWQERTSQTAAREDDGAAFNELAAGTDGSA